MTGPDPKISVVVPAYNSADTLERLLGSLDAQTLPQHEFEIVVVDDGSTDGTFELLQRLQLDRPNLVAQRIEPSGWASRPRNVGTELARGEYVLYMDSDDTLYPDALRRCYEYAVEQGADILNPKESQSKQPWWGMATYRDNVPNIRDGVGIAGLLPMTPHKVFRRAFLVEHGLRFEEAPAGERILWEDVRMVLAAYRASRVVSVLADTAVYHWHSNAGSISKSYGAHSAEFWDQVEGLLRFIHALFPGDEFAAERETMLLQQYKVRLLGRFTTFAVDATEEEVAAPFERLRQLQEQYMPLELDAGLGILDRSRAVLVRAGRLDLLLQLVRFDKRISNSCTVRDVQWRDGALHVISRTTWAHKGGAAFAEEDGRILRAMPAEVAEALPRELVDVTDELPSLTASVWVQDPDRIVTWAVPTTWSSRFVPTKSDGRTVEIVTMAVIDAATAEFGRPLERAAWDLWIETNWIGALRRSRMRFKGTPRAALHGDRLAIARRNAEDKLAVEVGAPAELALQLGRPPAGVAAGTTAQLRIPLPGVRAAGSGALPAEITVPSVTAGIPGAVLRGRVVATAERVDFEGVLAAAAGRYAIAQSSELLIRRGGRARLVAKRAPWTRARVTGAVARRARALRGS